jgi:hypothetical protein
MSTKFVAAGTPDRRVNGFRRRRQARLCPRRLVRRCRGDRRSGHPPGSMGNITFVPLVSWTNGRKGSGTWCHPGQPGYRYGDLVVAGYAGTGNVTAEIDTFDGVSAGSVHGGAGMS